MAEIQEYQNIYLIYFEDYLLETTSFLYLETTLDVGQSFEKKKL